jgi:hypothetical protein
MVSITEGIKQYARQEGHRTCIIGQSWKKSSRRARQFPPFISDQCASSAIKIAKN